MRIARLKKAKENADSLIGEMKAVSERIKAADERIAQLNATQSELLLTIPNLLDTSVPAGRSSEDNVEVRRWARHQNLISSRSHTGSWGKTQGFWTWSER